MGSLLQRGKESSGRRKDWRLPSPVHHPSPARKTLHHAREEEKRQMEEAEKWVEEARRLEDVGRSPSCHCWPNSWPRWLWRLDHLLWLRRSQSGGSSDLLLGGKAPQKEFLQAGKVKNTRKYQPGTVALWEIQAVPKEHWGPHQETPLLAVSPWDSPRSGQVWLVLQREHHHMPAGSCSKHMWSVSWKTPTSVP